MLSAAIELRSNLMDCVDFVFRLIHYIFRYDMLKIQVLTVSIVPSAEVQARQVPGAVFDIL